MNQILRMMISQAYRDPADFDGVDAGGGGGGGDANNGAGAEPALDTPKSDRIEIPDYGVLIDEYEERTPAKPAAGGKPNEVQQPAGGKPAGQQPPATPPAKPAVAPPAAQPPAAPAAQQPPAQQQQQAPQATPPQQQTPPAQQQPPAQQSQQQPAAPQAPAADQPLTFEQHRDKTLNALEPLFQMTPEEVEQLSVEPGKIMPKLAARVAFESMAMTFQALQAQLPQLINATMTNHSLQTESDKQFKERWPELYSDQHKELVLNCIKAYRAANPKATMEQLIEGAGAMATISLGQAYTPRQIQQQQQAAASQVPGAPPRPAGAGSTSSPIPPPRRGAQPSQGDDFADIWEAERNGSLSL